VKSSASTTVLGGYANVIVVRRRTFQPPTWFKAELVLADANTQYGLQSQMLRMV
jgi:hypothetical protein